MMGRERYIGQLELPVFFFFSTHDEVAKESLCIGLLNSYSSSIWHTENSSGFALELIFRHAKDS